VTTPLRSEIEQLREQLRRAEVATEQLRDEKRDLERQVDNVWSCGGAPPR
jgi:hypothetical protein